MLILWGVQISLIFPLQSYTSRSETPDGVRLIEPYFCHVRCQGASETVVGGGRTDAGLREETHPLLSSSWRPAEHQVPQMTAFGNQSPYLGVCVVSNVVEAIPYCLLISIATFNFPFATMEKWVQEVTGFISRIFVLIYRFCIRGPHAVVVASQDFTVVNSEEKCANKPLRTSYLVIAASLFLLDRKAEGIIKTMK